MSKKHMARPEWAHTQPRNVSAPVPEIQGKAKHCKEQSKPIIAGTQSPAQKVYHMRPHGDKPIPDASPVIDNDLARDNLENDIPECELPE